MQPRQTQQGTGQVATIAGRFFVVLAVLAMVGASEGVAGTLLAFGPGNDMEKSIALDRTNVLAVELRGTGNDPAVTVETNDVPASMREGMCTATTVLQEANNTIMATVRNAAGRVGTASLIVALDTTPPRVTIGSPRNVAQGTTPETGSMIHVKFRAGTNIDSPLLLLPPELQKAVANIKQLFSLSDQQLDRMGAGRLKLWFEVTVKPEVDTDVFLEHLKRLDQVEVAERAPKPAPPPQIDKDGAGT